MYIYIVSCYLRAPEVVDKVGRRHEVERGEAAVARRVVVVAVNGKNG